MTVAYPHHEPNTALENPLALIGTYLVNGASPDNDIGRALEKNQ